MRRESDGHNLNAADDVADLGTVFLRTMHATPSGGTGSLASQANLWRCGRGNGDGLGDGDGLVNNIRVGFGSCGGLVIALVVPAVVVVVRVVGIIIIGTGSSSIVVGIVSLVVASVIFTVGVVASGVVVYIVAKSYCSTKMKSSSSSCSTQKRTKRTKSR